MEEWRNVNWTHSVHFQRRELEAHQSLWPSTWKFSFLLADWPTQLLEPKGPSPDWPKGSLWELTHIIGKGALEPIKDKPPLLPRFNLAAHLDQVATADLVGE